MFYFKYNSYLTLVYSIIEIKWLRVMELLCTLQAICHLHMWLGLEEMDAGIELCACSFIPVTFFPTFI